MKRLVAILLVVLSLAAFGGAVSAAQYGTRDNPVTAGASLSFAECCAVAKGNYLAAQAQPPSLTAISNANAAVSISKATGVVDRLLVPYWPSGYSTFAGAAQYSQ